MIHELKENSIYFGKVISGEKTFEVRKDDRDYNVNDYLALNEYEAGGIMEGCYTGRSCLVKVTDILRDPEFVKAGYVIMSICPCRIEEHRHLPAAVYGVEVGGDEQ